MTLQSPNLPTVGLDDFGCNTLRKKRTKIFLKNRTFVRTYRAKKEGIAFCYKNFLHTRYVTYFSRYFVYAWNPKLSLAMTSIRKSAFFFCTKVYLFSA